MARTIHTSTACVREGAILCHLERTAERWLPGTEKPEVEVKRSTGGQRQRRPALLDNAFKTKDVGSC